MTNAIDLISSSFSTEQCNTYSLSIRKFPNGFSFCVVDLHNHYCVAVKHIPHTHWDQIQQEEPLFQLHYAKTTFISTSPFAIVPDTIYQECNMGRILPIEEFQKHRAKIGNNITDYAAKCIFDQRKFKQFDINTIPIHKLTPIIKIAAEQNQRDLIIVDVEEHEISLVIIKERKLILANVLSTETSDDISFYIMAIIQNYLLDPETTPVLFCGFFDDILGPYNILKNFIVNVKFIQPKSNWPDCFPKTLYPGFVSLIYSTICE